MKIALADAYAGTVRLYDDEVMGEHYDPPGPTFKLVDGRRVANLRKPVAQALIDRGIAERVDDETDADASDGDAGDADADGADESDTGEDDEADGGDEADEDYDEDADAET